MPRDALLRDGDRVEVRPGPHGRPKTLANVPAPGCTKRGFCSRRRPGARRVLTAGVSNAGAAVGRDDAVKALDFLGPVRHSSTTICSPHWSAQCGPDS